MIDFSIRNDIKATTVKRYCMHCNDEIVIGSPAARYAGKYDGDFSQAFCHVECADAGEAFNTAHKTENETWFWLSDVDHAQDLQWIIANCPDIVQDRINAAARVMKWHIEGCPMRTI